MIKTNDVKQDNRKNAPEEANYYALIAVIMNEKLSIDEAIRYFNL